MESKIVSDYLKQEPKKPVYIETKIDCCTYSKGISGKYIYPPTPFCPSCGLILSDLSLSTKKCEECSQLLDVY